MYISHCLSRALIFESNIIIIEHAPNAYPAPDFEPPPTHGVNSIIRFHRNSRRSAAEIVSFHFFFATLISGLIFLRFGKFSGPSGTRREIKLQAPPTFITFMTSSEIFTVLCTVSFPFIHFISLLLLLFI